MERRKVAVPKLRCHTCGKVLARIELIAKYLEMRRASADKKPVPRGLAMTQLGIRLYCCRAAWMGQFAPRPEWDDWKDMDDEDNDERDNETVMEEFRRLIGNALAVRNSNCQTV